MTGEREVVLSIRPEWCWEIIARRKTIEVRKSAPMYGVGKHGMLPYKCYIYCTLGGQTLYRSHADGEIRLYHKEAPAAFRHHTVMNGKVIGEFACGRVDRYGVFGTDRMHLGYRLVDKQFRIWPIPYAEIGMSEDELEAYGGGKELRGLHISGLTVYDKPRELGDFRRACENGLYCESCAMYNAHEDACGNEALRLRRPPQSWCYVKRFVS